MDNVFEQLLARALRNKVTDIHFRQNQQQTEILMRTINGIVKVSFGDDVRLFNYLQYQANLDITSDKPQSGSFSYFYKGIYYDFRLAVMSSQQIRDGVLRILNCHRGLSLEQLTFDEDIRNLFARLITLRSGLVIFTGLTGSGKTTTIYSLLRLIKGKSIYSLEDPIEVVQDNVVQLQINEKTGFDYNGAIKQVLRHNPDVLMIGEIRDEGSARAAIRAALTGCLVFTSLHSRSAVSALRRLTELGISENDLRESITAVFNQRLVKLRKRNGYCCIYEYIDSRQVADYFSKLAVRGDMEERLQRAVSSGLIAEGDYGD